MRCQFLSLFLLLVAVLLTGCEESLTETTEETTPEVTARFCYIARIGNLVKMHDFWEESTPEKTVSLLSLPEGSTLMESVPAKVIGEEVDPDILAIVESTAHESTSDEGLQKTKEKKEELNLAIEMVEDGQKTDSAIKESLDQEVQEEETEVQEDVEKTENDENEEEIAISMTDEDAEESEEKDAEVKAEKNTENSVSETGKEGEIPTEKEKTRRFEQMDSELEHQAEEFLNLLKETPKEVREELIKAHFQNVTYRLVKVPGMLFQGTASDEYYIIRTMEYTGTNLSQDFQVLSLSPNYAQWLNDQEKFLEILTLDSLHHEYWVEVPEFWNSSKE